MQTTWKATLVGVGGIVAGALIAFIGILFATPDDSWTLMGGSADPGSASDPVGFAGVAIGLAVALVSLWLAARISGQPHRLRSTVSGFAAGGLAAAATFELRGGSVGEVLYIAAPAIAVAVAVRSDVPRAIVPRIVGVLAASALLFVASIEGATNPLAAMIIVAFAIPLADAATDQYSTATR